MVLSMTPAADSIMMPVKAPVSGARPILPCGGSDISVVTPANRKAAEFTQRL
jgi:hypothetical protein